jgi:CheY-like chemotaxis protein
MATDRMEVKKKLKEELANLTLTLDGNKEKVDAMVRSFLDETPADFASLRESIKNEKKDDLLSLLHKLKPRYGYLGFDNLMRELNDWEKEARITFNTKKNEERFQYFEDMNTLIINELAQNGTEQEGIFSPALAKLPLSGKKVLIAEDDEVNAMVFSLFIEELGGVAIKAADGHEAVRQVTENTPDFIFMDIHMPYFSGVEAIKLLRSKRISIPIIALSASTRLQEKQQSLDAGATGFLTKPAKRDIIHEVLLKYLG